MMAANEITFVSDAEIMNCFKFAAWALALLASRGYATESSQLSTEQARVLEAVRASALQYTHQLPNFICKQITHREVLKTKPNALGVSSHGQTLTRDTIEEQLTYNGGKESYNVLTVNGHKAFAEDHLQFAGAISSGEFGTIFTIVFDPGSNTTFSWDREAKVGGRRAWAFKYHVPKEAGTVVVYQETHSTIVAPFSGEVLIDPENSDVLEISSQLELPADFPIRKVDRKIDYAVHEIGGKIYRLPAHSELHMEQGAMEFNNKIAFASYHHFSTESKLHFGDDAK